MTSRAYLGSSHKSHELEKRRSDGCRGVGDGRCTGEAEKFRGVSCARRIRFAGASRNFAGPSPGSPERCPKRPSPGSGHDKSVVTPISLLIALIQVVAANIFHLPLFLLNNLLLLPRVF